MRSVGVGSSVPGRGRLVAVAALVLMSVPGAGAFNYPEHCKVSNDALMIALGEARSAGLDGEKAVWIERRASDRCGKPSAADRPTSYGRWVGLADFAVQATDLYVHEENARAWEELDGDVIPEDRVVSLAPGHVMTPRRAFHDVPALAMHDHYNRKGDRYFPDQAASLAALVSDRPADACEWAGWCDEASVRARLEGLEKDGVLMKGDGRLFGDEDERLVVTLTVARSVLDVLESYMARAPVNHFVDYRWSGYSRVDEGGRLRTPRSGTPYGEYRPHETRGLLAFDPALGLSLGTQAFVGDEGPSTRWRVGAELLVGGSPGGRWLYKGGPFRLIPQFGVTVGYDFLKGAGVSGHSVGARLVKPITQLDLQLSAVARYTWYRVGPGSVGVSAFEWGGRLELGFGLVFLGVGVERVAVPTASSADARRTALTTFVAVHPPRLFGLLR